MSSGVPFARDSSYLVSRVSQLLTSVTDGCEKNPISDDESRAKLLKLMEQFEKEAAAMVALRDVIHDHYDYFDNDENLDVDIPLNVAAKLEEMISNRVDAVEGSSENILHDSFVRLTAVLNMKPGDESVIAVESDENDDDNANGGDDIIAENNDVILRMLDPITKNRITDPMRNIHCEHVYDRPSIMQHINDNRIRKLLCQCPQPGCTNKLPMAEKDLEEYPEFFNLAAL